jgi:hypothetical protein
VAKLVDETTVAGRWRALPVRKNRRRFRIGSIKAEVTAVRVDGEPDRLATMAIEGPNLPELVELRDHVGLGDAPNLALHLAVDPLRTH